MEECFSTSSILIPFTSFASVSFADIFRARVLACACPRAALDGARRRSTSTPVRSTQRRRRASRAPQIFKTKSAGEFSRITSARIVLSAPPKEKNAHATLFKCFGLRDTVRPRAHLPGTGAEGTAVRGRAFALGAPRRDGGPDHGRAAAAVAPPDALVRVWGRRPVRLLRRLGPRDPRLPAHLRDHGRLAPARVRVHPAQGAHLLRAEEASEPGARPPGVEARVGPRRSRESRIAPLVLTRTRRQRPSASRPSILPLFRPPTLASPSLPPPPPKNPPPAPRRTAPRPSLGPTARGATPFSVG